MEIPLAALVMLSLLFFVLLRASGDAERVKISTNCHIQLSSDTDMGASFLRNQTTLPPQVSFLSAGLLSLVLLLPLSIRS